MAGAYSATILRESEKLIADLRADGYEPVALHLRAQGRGLLPLPRRRLSNASGKGESDSPSPETAREIATVLLERFLDPDPDDAASAPCTSCTRASRPS